MTSHNNLPLKAYRISNAESKNTLDERKAMEKFKSCIKRNFFYIKNFVAKRKSWEMFAIRIDSSESFPLSQWWTRSDSEEPGNCVQFNHVEIDWFRNHVTKFGGCQKIWREKLVASHHWRCFWFGKRKVHLKSYRKKWTKWNQILLRRALQREF